MQLKMNTVNKEITDKTRIKIVVSREFHLIVCHIVVGFLPINKQTDKQKDSNQTDRQTDNRTVGQIVRQ